MKNICEKCKSYELPGGYCRRYPEHVKKEPDEWCGEFNEASLDESVVLGGPKVEALPKGGEGQDHEIDGKTSCTNSFGKSETSAAQTSPSNRRRRKRGMG